MASIDGFLLSWFYGSHTKLAIQFSTLGANVSSNTDVNLEQNGISSSAAGRLDYTNGLGTVLNEDYNLENIITDYPVENFQSISDHIVVRPKVIKITGLLTSLSVIPLFGQIPSLLNFNQIGRAIQFLFNASDSRQLFTLTTGLFFGQSLFQIKNVAIQSINIPRDSLYSKSSIKFNIVFKEIFITSTSPTSGSSKSNASLDPNIGGP